MNTVAVRQLAVSLAALSLTAAAVTPALAQPAAEPAAELTEDAVVRAPASDKPVRRHRRMALEATAVLAVGAAWYWRDLGKSNEVDWQLPWDRSALGAKLGGGSDGWRFDGNAFELNALCHPGFGALTHYLARKNGYSLGETFLISTLTSGAWELIVEWAEFGSINDMLSTSTTGVPVGEAFYQLARNWRTAKVEVRTGAGSEAGDAFGVIGAHAAVDTLPTQGAGMVGAGRKVGAGVEVPFDGAIRAIEAGAKTSLVGFYQHGAHHSLFAGVSGEFYYRDRKDRPSREADLVSFTGAGPTLDVQLRGGGVTVDVGADLYAEFAMVKAQAFTAWRAENPSAVVRNSMQDKARPYYYGYGLTATPRLNVHYRGLNLGGKLAVSGFGSIEGHDRDQEMLTADPHMTDRDTFAQGWAGYAGERFAITLDGRVRQRSGAIDGLRAETSDRTTMVTLAYRR